MARSFTAGENFVFLAILQPHRDWSLRQTRGGSLLKIPVFANTDASINTNALTDTSIFYRVQEAKRKKINNKWFCPRSVVPGTLRTLSIQHKGAVAQPGTYPNSHPGIFGTHVDSAAFRVYEGVQGKLNAAGLMLTATTAALYDAAVADSKAMHDDGRNYITYSSLGNCIEFHFAYP